MKKLIVVFVLILFSLIGCSQTTNNQAQADLPPGFEVVSKTERSNNGSRNVYELRHIKTSCYFAYSSNNDNGTISSLTQIYIEKNGVSVPYCD